MATKDKLVTLEDLNELKKYNDSEVSDLKSELNDLGNYVRYENPVLIANHSQPTTQSTTINVNNSTFDVDISSGDSFSVCVVDNNSTINKYAVYTGDTTRLGSNLVPNTVYTYTATADITSLYLYIAAQDVLKTGQINAVVNKLTINENALDTKITKIDLLETSVNTLWSVNTSFDPSLFDRRTWTVSSSNNVTSTQYNFRVGSIGALKFIGSVTISVKNGFRIGIVYNDGNINRNTGWLTSKYTLPANTDIYINISRISDDTTETADIDEFVGALSFSYGLSEMLEEGNYLTYNANFTTVRTVAHRGRNKFAPQCTEPAYILARKHGAIWAENDVAKTADGAFVMWHDTTLKKLGNLIDINGYEVYTNGADIYYYDSDNDVVYEFADNRYVAVDISVSALTRCQGNNYSTDNFTLEQIKRIDFGAWFSDTYSGTQILTFDEWVILCKKLGMGIYIDHKFTYTRSECEVLVGVVKKYGMLRKAVWLVHPDIATYIRQYDNEAVISWIPNILTYPTVNDAIAYLNSTGLSGDVRVSIDGKTATESDAQLIINNGYAFESYYVDYGSDLTEADIFDRINELVEYGASALTLDTYNVCEAFEDLLNKYD